MARARSGTSILTRRSITEALPSLGAAEKGCAKTPPSAKLARTSSADRHGLLFGNEARTKEPQAATARPPDLRKRHLLPASLGQGPSVRFPARHRQQRRVIPS